MTKAVIALCYVVIIQMAEFGALLLMGRIMLHVEGIKVVVFLSMSITVMLVNIWQRPLPFP